MTEPWKDWEGQVADAQFPLRRYLGGADHSAIYLTEYGDGEKVQAAIKLIAADPDTAETQLSRWRQAAKLIHPNLLRIFQAGRCRLGERNMLYVVTEYAAEDLSLILPQRPLTLSETRDMLAPILDALAYLHSNGFVHGHIKPSNIMAVDEQLKISSDGLCRAGRPSAGRSKPGAYDAPETLGGAPSPAGDVWSLGMTVVEAVTQRLPVWEHIREEEPSLPDNLPPEFRDLARHCLYRDPMRRWTVADITRWLQPAGIAPAVAPDRREPAVQASGVVSKYANWRYLVPAAAMALLLIAMLAGPKLLTRRMEAQPAVGESGSGPAAVQPLVQPASQPKPAAQEPPPAPAPKSAEAKTDSSEPAPPVAAPKPAPVSAASGGVVKGEVLEQALPAVSEKARNSIEGRVRVSVRVRVDSSGKVAEAVFDDYGPSKYFAEQANAAATRWKFFPPTVNGQNVPSEWTLRFEFTNSGTTVHPSQAKP